MRKLWNRFRCWLFGPRVVRGSWVRTDTGYRFEATNGPVSIGPGETVEFDARMPTIEP